MPSLTKDSSFILILSKAINTDETRSFLILIFGKDIVRQENHNNMIVQAIFDIIFPVVSLIVSLAKPYVFSLNHTYRLKRIMEVVSSIIKFIALIYIVALSLQFDDVMSFFYLNALIILIITIFRQSA